MNPDTLICIWILGISNRHNWSFDPSNCSFWLYFISLHYYWPPTTWNSLVVISWGEMKRCGKRSLQLLKMRKKKISWNPKTENVTDFSLTGLRVWRIILVIMGWAHKRQTFILISIKIMRIWKILF